MEDLDKKIFAINPSHEQVGETLSNGFKQEGGVWDDEEYTITFGENVYYVCKLECINFDDVDIYQFQKI